MNRMATGSVQATRAQQGVSQHELAYMKAVTGIQAGRGCQLLIQDLKEGLTATRVEEHDQDMIA